MITCDICHSMPYMNLYNNGFGSKIPDTHKKPSCQKENIRPDRYRYLRFLPVWVFSEEPKEEPKAPAVSTLTWLGFRGLPVGWGEVLGGESLDWWAC